MSTALRSAHRVLHRRKPPAPVLAAVILALAPGAGPIAQVRQVIDLSEPVDGVSVVLPERWDGDLPPVFLGDVNGDGLDDFGALLLSDGGSDTALVYGSRELQSGVALTALPQTVLRHGIRGEGGVYGAGCSKHLAGLGDVDGDGFADFLYGSCRTTWEGIERSGAALLIYGSPELPDILDLTELARTDGFGGVRRVLFISEEASSLVGWVVERAGDMNGDGFTDYAFGLGPSADRGTEDGVEGAGGVVVFFGGPNVTGDVLIAQVGRSVPGFRMRGAYGDDRAGGHPGGDHLGSAIAPAGDFNGDGFDDLLVGAGGVSRNGMQYLGAAYLIFGGEDLPPEVFAAELDGVGVEFLGGRVQGGLGIRVAAAGDVDGDGLDDVLISAAIGHPGAEEVFLVYGTDTLRGTVVLDGEETVRRFRLRASPDVETFSPEGTRLGLGLAGVGDVNRDGFADFVCGAPEEDRDFEENVGAAYLIYGGPDLPAEARDSDVGTERLPGIKLLGGRPFAEFGSGVSADGADFDGDGEEDFFISTDWRARSSIKPVWDAIYLLHGGDTLRPVLGISSVRPAVGSVAGGIDVRVLGRGFSGNERVFFGDLESPEVTVVHGSELRAALPPRWPPGHVDVVVESNGARASLPDAFEYVDVRQYPDLVLDEAGLEASPFRSAVYEFEMPPMRFLSRGFASMKFGDLDGDGLDDLAIGQRFNDEVVILFGREDYPERIRPGTPEHESLVTTIRKSAGDPGGFGAPIEVLGDVDGDGIDELVIQDIPSPSLPRTIVLFGRREWPARLSIEDEIASGAAIEIRLRDCYASSVAAPGDLDGDGIPDLMTGNTQCTGDRGGVQLYMEGLERGAVGLEPTRRITGDPVTLEDGQARIFGVGLAPGGDLNGDGLLDLVVGAAHSIGEIHFLLAVHWEFRLAPELEFFDLDRGVRVVREEPTLTRLGEVATFVGDFNGDGLSDVAVGLPLGGIAFHGESFVVFGSTRLGEEVREIDLGEDSGAWVQVVGEFPEDRSGYVRGIGDFNGDGLDDVAIAGVNIDEQTPRAYVVFGSASGPSRLDLGELGIHGFKITSDEGSWLSSAHQGIAGGDLDGDGNVDLAISEFVSDAGTVPNFGQAAPGRGRVTIIFGRRTLGADFVRGDANVDGGIDISDAVLVLNALFADGGRIDCDDAADSDDNGVLNITDPVLLLGVLFGGGGALPAPATCAPDPTADTLSCGEGCDAG